MPRRGQTIEPFAHPTGLGYLIPIVPAAGNPPLVPLLDVMQRNGPAAVGIGAVPTGMIWNLPVTSTVAVPMVVAVVGAAAVPVQQVAIVVVRVGANQFVLPVTVHTPRLTT